jgi:HK97 gp10 family phage protein
MADDVNIRITGLPEFISRLRALSLDMQRKVTRAGAMAAGNVFRKAAVANAPILQKPDTRKNNPRVPGTLQKAVYAARSRIKSKPGKELIVVGVRSDKASAARGKGAFYWRFVENGHLVRGPGQKIKGGTNRATLERNRLKAGGAKFVPPVFFMKRAFSDNQDAAIKAFNERIEKRIQKANKELNER